MSKVFEQMFGNSEKDHYFCSNIFTELKINNYECRIDCKARSTARG